MPNATTEIVSYMEGEINEMMDEKNWGELITELYNPAASLGLIESEVNS
jgi:hypothetical protein